MATKQLCIVYNHNITHELIACIDSDHSSDKTDFISLKGLIIMYAKGSTSWKSKKDRVSQSSIYAELNGLIQTANITCKVGRIFAVIYGYEKNESIKQPTTIYCDNYNTLQIVSTGSVSNKPNHITQDACLDYHYMEDHKRDAKKIDTEYYLADIVTKPVTGR